MNAPCSSNGNRSGNTSKQTLATEATSLHALQELQAKLVSVTREMHDLAEWRMAQLDNHPMPHRHVFSAAESSMDRLSDETVQICNSMAALAARTIADLKCKASALDYLLPEEADPHITLCRSLCGDIRSL